MARKLRTTSRSTTVPSWLRVELFSELDDLRTVDADRARMLRHLPDHVVLEIPLLGSTLHATILHSK
ncbi:hypothetical protein [Kribbella voronezhensis]|uniref:hypothetical protein n=1 Tax=Kribbella voronezhensis TaxID=2512212 RepID=UPI0010633ED1|nr:hypothetical protein [Kribbella voronezhensis]